MSVNQFYSRKDSGNSMWLGNPQMTNPQCPDIWGNFYKGAEKSMSGNRVDQHKGSDYGMSRGNPRLVGEVKMVGGGGIGGGG